MLEKNHAPTLNLWECEAETIVREVPVDYFNNDLDMKAYIRRLEKHDSWKKDIQRLLREFDIDSFEPLYYCRRCKRIEDGSHRFYIAKLKGMKTFSVRIGEKCFKHIRPRTPIKIFEDTMRQTKDIGTMDYKWLRACAKDKWVHFDKIDFNGKTFFDVGCNVGYSCVEANRRGASLSVGIDVRNEVVSVANVVQDKLDISYDYLKFAALDWRKSEFLPFDIVSCMVLMHYFSIYEYDSMIKKLIQTCRETLILELRVLNSKNSKLVNKGGQTLATRQWLSNNFKRLGFKINKRVVRGANRELWIAER